MKSHYRKATEKEIQFYHEKLYPLQDEVFEIAKQYDNKLYLTGGTALSRFYFNHRFSEDLDFFTTTDDLRLIANDLAAKLKEKGLEITIEKAEIYFARFFVEEKDFQLKVEFVKEFNLWGKLARTESGIYVNNLEDIAANKIAAFEDRAEAKDIIDLYYLTKKISFRKMFEIALLKRVPVPYEELLTVNARGISGRVLINEDIPEENIEKFVEELKHQVSEEIKKKETAAMDNIAEIVKKMLWDFPPEDRVISQYSIPVLKRRLHRLPLPEKRALEKLL